MNVDVINAARAIGLDPTGTEITGTIEETRVLAALSDLAEQDPSVADLVAGAAAAVRHSRSAGADELAGWGRGDQPVTTQLRYRAEMAAIFVDLAIDVGLRHTALVDAAR